VNYLKRSRKMTINEVLHKIQQELKVPKAQYNSFGKYNYRSCEDIVEAVKKMLPEGYILLLCDEMVEVGGRCYVKAKAIITNGEERLEVYGYAREALNKKGMDESQITGTASTYARKYALNGMFAIDDTKDNDTDESRIEADKRKEKADREFAAKKLENEIATAAKLKGMIEGVQSTARLVDFENNDKVKELREKLLINNPALSTEVDTAITMKQASFIDSPSNLTSYPLRAAEKK
jgi:hypothetical protein